MAEEAFPASSLYLQLSHISGAALCAQPPLRIPDWQVCQQERASAVGLGGYFILSEAHSENHSFFQEHPGTRQPRQPQKPSSCLLPARSCWHCSTSLPFFTEKYFFLFINSFSISVGTFLHIHVCRCSLHVPPQASLVGAGGSKHQVKPIDASRLSSA